MLDESLLLQLGQHGERFGDRSGRGAVEAADAEVHEIEHVESEVLQVLVDGFDQLLAGQGHRPRAVGCATCSDLRGDVQSVAIGVKGLADRLVHGRGSVVVARVDMGNTQLDRLAKHYKRSFTDLLVLGR